MGLIKENQEEEKRGKKRRKRGIEGYSNYSLTSLLILHNRRRENLLPACHIGHNRCEEIGSGPYQQDAAEAGQQGQG